jgi:hypothetical protein
MSCLHLCLKYPTDVNFFVGACNVLIETNLTVIVYSCLLLHQRTLIPTSQTVWHDQNVSSGILFHTHCKYWWPQLWENVVVVKYEIG